ncbi:hypothetical protein DFH07DRAFT_975516 [Mycena maculata]|uniref:Peptidase S33 tripeptidyl aminopeptidase-like C-terminal domain-containing protein n=1 Tax=Mycena maculata TaxID=230809 RepID=A0AAD7KK89_9AGAR|nr:hypothetical protein DFH07DRAFT_975516 [Mycena maculata]
MPFLVYGRVVSSWDNGSAMTEAYASHAANSGGTRLGQASVLGILVCHSEFRFWELRSPRCSRQENVERLVIDGVVDSEMQVRVISQRLIKRGPLLSMVAFLLDRKAVLSFLPLQRRMQASVEKIHTSLLARPIPVRTDTSFGLVDYSMLRSAMFFSLHSPIARFPVLTQALAGLAAGDGTALFKMSERPAFKCGCDPSEFRFEAGVAVSCNDEMRIFASYENALEHYQNRSKMSEWEDILEPYWLSCEEADFCLGITPRIQQSTGDFPKKHFQGPFVANTSFPLLIIGNTAGGSSLLMQSSWLFISLADPITLSGRTAKNMSRGFPGSVVLTQDSTGHCSLSSPSLCTQKYIRGYFLNGTLPTL